MKRNIFFFLALTAITLLTACSGEELSDNVTNIVGDKYVYNMSFDGDISDYGSNGAKTRATKSWNNGDVVYIRATSFNGTATYNNGNWTLETNTAISGSGTCTACHFVGSLSETANNVTINQTTAIYEGSGSYNKSGNTITVSANLSPKVGRLRFKGTSGTTFTLSGITHYTSYDKTTGAFTSSSNSINSNIASSGYSSYIYGYYSNASSPVLTYMSNNETYSTSSLTGMYQAGQSGYLTAPTSSNYTGWEKAISFTANGVSFKMVKVLAGTFIMGATAEMENPYSDETPTHQVTLTKDYYIGQTEVTQALWQAVMGSNPSHSKGDNKPVESISWIDCQTFISKLNTLTGKTFRLPTEAEWEFAARGGNKSKHTQYSGSANIEDVAWYGGNCYSTDDVATKLPNELGIYDMSGNVYEWCYNWYEGYSSNAQTNPTGPTSGSNRIFRGGCWYSNAKNSRLSYRSFGIPYNGNDGIGLRLALSEF